MLELPKLLDIPPKLLPLITEFSKYRYFLVEGGRGSAKTQSVARLILYLADLYKIRVVCGRETQNSIAESVYTVLKDRIVEYGLNFNVLSNRIDGKTKQSEIAFKGFREQGSINIRGLEAVDLLWVDEAQSLTTATVNVLIPTIIRYDSAKLMFTMNRNVVDDAIFAFLANHPECLHIKINYFDNPHVSQATLDEAEACRKRSERDYKHIWLGEPLSQSDKILINYDDLIAAQKTVAWGDGHIPARIMGIDFAAQGQDLCVATIIDRVSPVHWRIVEQISWDEPNSMVSVGKIVDLIGKYKPDHATLDVGGMGTVVHSRLEEIGLNIHRFDGASGGNDIYYNNRAIGYYTLRDWLEQKWLIVDSKYADMIKELSKVEIKFRSDGKRLIAPKEEYRKHNQYSPDKADSLMMAVFCAVTNMGRESNMSKISDSGISKPKRVSNRGW